MIGALRVIGCSEGAAARLSIYLLTSTNPTVSQFIITCVFTQATVQYRMRLYGEE